MAMRLSADVSLSTKGTVVHSLRDLPPSATSKAPLQQLPARRRTKDEVVTERLLKEAALASDALKGAGVETLLTLWQLLTVQATGDKERRELLATHYAAARRLSQAIGGAGSSATTPSLIRNLEIGRTLDMRQFLNRASLKRASLDASSIRVSEVFWRRLQSWRRVGDVPVALRFLRWELLKLTMLHGCHQEGVLYDDEGSGSTVCVPLTMTEVRRWVVPPPALSISSSPHHHAHASNPAGNVGRDGDEWLEHALHRVYSERTQLLFSERAVAVSSDLFNAVTRKGGCITRPVYFAMMLIFCKNMLVHLSDVEIHQLIAADFMVDGLDMARTIQKLFSSNERRRSAALAAVGHEASVELQQQDVNAASASVADSLEVLHRHSFHRFVASLAMIWMERASFFEFSQFVDALRCMWLPRIELFDLDFVVRYDQGSYVPPDASLVCTLPTVALHNDTVLHAVAQHEVVKSIFIRFRMYTGGKEDALAQSAEHLRRVLATAAPSKHVAGDAAVIAMGRKRNKQSRTEDIEHHVGSPAAAASKGGWTFGLPVPSEPLRRDVGSSLGSGAPETIAEIAVPQAIDDATSPAVRDVPAAQFAETVASGPILTQHSHHRERGGSRHGALRDSQGDDNDVSFPIVDAVLHSIFPPEPLTQSAQAANGKGKDATLVNLKIDPANRTAKGCITMRVVQYKSLRPCNSGPATVGAGSLQPTAMASMRLTDYMNPYASLLPPLPRQCGIETLSVSGLPAPSSSPSENRITPAAMLPQLLHHKPHRCPAFLLKHRHALHDVTSSRTGMELDAAAQEASKASLGASRALVPCVGRQVGGGASIAPPSQRPVDLGLTELRRQLYVS